MRGFLLVAQIESFETHRRFWAKVDKNGPVPEHRPDLGACWEWTAAKNKRGYGRFGLGSDVVIYAHRFAYRKAVGPIPEDREMDHLCENRSCVRPPHLEAVTHAQNCERAYRRRQMRKAA